MPNRFFLKRRPSRVLGFLLSIFSIFFLLFVGWELIWPNICLIGYPPPKFEVGNWLFFIVGFSALTGWIVSSIMTIRNSIKQHTINTLLQTRLSAQYMGYAEVLNKTFFRKNQQLTPQGMDHWQLEENSKEYESLLYILNFCEFISAGIRYGDLDENLMKGTLRGILIRLYEFSKLLILEFHNKDSRGFEHIIALYERWK